MGCYCFTIGAFISACVSAAGFWPGSESLYPNSGGDPPDLLVSLILGPVIESLMLAGVFELLRRIRTFDWVQVFTSAVLVSGMHFWPWWPHAIIVLPGFLIQAASYLYWRQTSWKAAFSVLVSIHVLANVVPAITAISRVVREA